MAMVDSMGTFSSPSVLWATTVKLVNSCCVTVGTSHGFNCRNTTPNVPPFNRHGKSWARKLVFKTAAIPITSSFAIEPPRALSEGHVGSWSNSKPKESPWRSDQASSC